MKKVELLELLELPSYIIIFSSNNNIQKWNLKVEPTLKVEPNIKPSCTAFI